jgi:4-amino-4-deoxy-L-arabinose transferase-like glycosyltransferase
MDAASATSAATDPTGVRGTAAVAEGETPPAAGTPSAASSDRPVIGGGALGSSGDDPEGRPFPRWIRIVLAVLFGLALAFALVLRFWTRSDLWLDEALTVNISAQPIAKIPDFLRRDGAPPLFYVLLHFWMGLFGHSDLAVRSLSGVIGVITLPVTWIAGRRLGGRTVAWAALAFVATSPFAVYYDTEARMYALVALLAVLGYLAVDRALRHPRPGNLVAVAVLTAGLLYSHYWSIYLVSATGLWLIWRWAHDSGPARRPSALTFGAMVVGGLAFVPWLPIFIFQARHTGTPWAAPANFAGMVHAFTTFAGGGTNQGRALGIVYFALLGLGVFGVARDRRHIDLDLRTRPRSRPLAWVVVATLGLAILGGYVSRSAFSSRYASVVFVLLVLLVALGMATFLDRRIRTVILGVAIVAGMVGSIANITNSRTQAGQVSRAVVARSQPGDVVAYCPDQLGPAVARLLPGSGYRQLTFPRGTGPEFVNWVDYAKAVAAASPVAFAVHLEALAGTTHRIFVVWAPGYQVFSTDCQQIIETIQANPHYATSSLVAGSSSTYEPMWLYEFTPHPS